MTPWALHIPADPPVKLVVHPGRVFRIGRDVEAELCLDDRLVSRRHAELHVTDTGGLDFVDLGSRNGTKLNGKPATGRIPLRPGDELKIGAATLIVDGAQPMGASGGKARAYVRDGVPEMPKGPSGNSGAIATNEAIAVPAFFEHVGDPAALAGPRLTKSQPTATASAEDFFATAEPVSPASSKASPTPAAAPARAAEAKPPAPLSATSIPGYELGPQMARGRTGVLHRAKKLGADGGERIVKVLDPAAAASENAASRFASEAAALGKVDHPNLARVLDVGSFEGRHYYAMEAVQGRTLEEILKEGILEPRDAIAIASQVARGLGAAQHAGIVHRDIAPASILVTPELVAKVFDFAFILVREESPALTDMGDVVGDLHYCAPEQANNPRSVDARADFYGLGATIFHALVGHPPIDGKGYLDMYRKLVSDVPPPLHELVPEVRPKLSQCVARLLEKEPEKRYATATELALALDEALFEAVLAARTYIPPKEAGIGAEFRGVEMLHLIQVIAQRKASGYLAVAGDGPDLFEGEISFRTGEIAGARTVDTDETGAAIQSILAVRSGRFAFRTDATVPAAAEGPLSAEEVALEALRRR